MKILYKYIFLHMKIAVVAESEFFNEDLVGFLTHEDQWRRMQDQLVFVFDVEQLVGKLFSFMDLAELVVKL